MATVHSIISQGGIKPLTSLRHIPGSEGTSCRWEQGGVNQAASKKKQFLLQCVCFKAVQLWQATCLSPLLSGYTSPTTWQSELTIPITASNDHSKQQTTVQPPVTTAVSLVGFHDDQAQQKTEYRKTKASLLTPTQGESGWAWPPSFTMHFIKGSPQPLGI